MNAQLTINGQTISIELTQEQIEQLTKKKPAKRWEDLKEVSGWYIDSYSEPVYIENVHVSSLASRRLYATENQARSALAMAMLSQLMKDVNGEWKPTWNSTYQKKYIIEFTNFKINTNYYYEFPCFLSFPTKEIRDEFLANHRELIEEYFLLYK